MEQTQKRKNQQIKKIAFIFDFIKQTLWLKQALIALTVFIFILLFIFQIEVVNSQDMGDTIHVGDLVLINKLSSNYKQNDLLYFKYPIIDSLNSTPFFIQRCVALPGDTLFIENKIVYVNHKALEEETSLKHNYIIELDTVILDSTIINKFCLFEGGKLSKNGVYGFSLTKWQRDSLKTFNKIKNIQLRLEKENVYDERVFPSNKYFVWNLDNFGEIYIPKKQDTLILDTNNIKLYRQIIKDYENNTLEIKNDSIFINNLNSKYYIVKQNYYFVMGDNRDNAVDSRRWGFLPQSAIKGKVAATLFKKN